MSTIPAANQEMPAPTPSCPEWTEADHDALFASVVWFRTRCDPAVVDKYAGMYVAILGEQILDADRDKDELLRRLNALGDTICRTRVLLQYVHRSEDWNWK